MHKLCGHKIITLIKTTNINSSKFISSYIDKDLVFQEKKGNTANSPMKGEMLTFPFLIYTNTLQRKFENSFTKRIRMR